MLKKWALAMWFNKPGQVSLASYSSGLLIWNVDLKKNSHLIECSDEIIRRHSECLDLILSFLQDTKLLAFYKTVYSLEDSKLLFQGCRQADLRFLGKKQRASLLMTQQAAGTPPCLQDISWPRNPMGVMWHGPEGCTQWLYTVTGLTAEEHRTGNPSIS